MRPPRDALGEEVCEAAVPVKVSLEVSLTVGLKVGLKRRP